MALSLSTIVKEHEEVILTFIQQMELSFEPDNQEDEELVRRAMFAVRNKYIHFEKYIPVKFLLQILVQDVRPAKVQINFKEKRINCDCNKNEWCRHKVSSVLALYQYIDSVTDWLSNWRAKKDMKIDMLSAERTPESWKKMVELVFSHHLKPQQKIDGNLLNPIMEACLSKLMKSIPFEREWQPLYKLFIKVYFLNIMWEHIEKTNSFIKTTQFDHFFNKYFEEISNSVEEVKGHSHLFATDPFFDELQVIVRTILLNRKKYLDKKVKLYFLFWDKIFTEKKRAAIELNILNQSFSSEFRLSTIENIFYILLKDNSRLQQNLQTINISEMPIYFYLAEFAFVKKQNKSGEFILKALLPYLYDYIHGHLLQQHRKPFVKKIHALYENIILTSEEEAVLFSAYGPYGLQPYSDYLLKMKQYEKWAALHQIHSSSISYLEANGLNEVIENAPTTALPLLHFYAMCEIEQKTRINYKEAASILIKMKHAAQKAGKRNFWQDYIHQIQLRFKRLKALQEELEKENILS